MLCVFKLLKKLSVSLLSDSIQCQPLHVRVQFPSSQVIHHFCSPPCSASSSPFDSSIIVFCRRLYLNIFPIHLVFLLLIIVMRCCFSPILFKAFSLPAYQSISLKPFFFTTTCQYFIDTFLYSFFTNCF